MSNLDKLMEEITQCKLTQLEFAGRSMGSKDLITTAEMVRSLQRNDRQSAGISDEEIMKARNGKGKPIPGATAEEKWQHLAEVIDDVIVALTEILNCSISPATLETMTPEEAEQLQQIMEEINASGFREHSGNMNAMIMAPTTCGNASQA